MTLRYVILTVLSTREATGYDIAKELSYNIGNFWKAQHQQVYRELAILVINSSVTCKLVPQAGKPDRKVYSITEIGRETLVEWFHKPANHPAIRDELSAKLRVCDIHNSEPMQQHIEALFEESRTLLNHYRGLEQSQFTDHQNLDRQARLERLTLRRNIHNRQATLAWAEEVQAELKELDSLEPPARLRINTKAQKL